MTTLQQILRSVKSSVLLLSIACAHISMTEQQARAGYVAASLCIGWQANIPFNKIKREIIKGDGFTLNNDTAVYVGYAFPKIPKVLISEAYKDQFKLWAHEYLHVLGRTVDTTSAQASHPDSLFLRCNL